MTKKTTTMEDIRVEEWFAHLMHNDPANEHLTVRQRRKNAEEKIPGILANSTHGDEWEIEDISWDDPTPPSRRHRMRVMLREKPNIPPGDAILPKKPPTPPPSM